MQWKLGITGIGLGVLLAGCGTTQASTWKNPVVATLPANVKHLLTTNIKDNSSWWSLIQLNSPLRTRNHPSPGGTLRMAGSHLTWVMPTGYVNLWETVPGIMQNHQAILKWNIVHGRLVPATKPLQLWAKEFFDKSTQAETKWSTTHFYNLTYDLPTSVSSKLYDSIYPHNLELAKKYEATDLGTSQTPSFRPYQFISTYANPTVGQLEGPGANLVFFASAHSNSTIGMLIEKLTGYNYTSWSAKNKYPGTWTFQDKPHGLTIITWKLKVVRSISDGYSPNSIQTFKFVITQNGKEVVSLNTNAKTILTIEKEAL